MTDIRRTFPGREWERAGPEEVGFDAERLAGVGQWQAEHAAGAPYRLLVARHGRLIAEWHGGGLGREDLQPQASASKSTYATVLGIAVEEGTIPSVDARVADYYPEMLDVAPGEGPKDGRHVFPENSEITFRQLIGNTSGYMKPGEAPGKVFHYQTFGMNILTHALAALHSLYKTNEPKRGPGFGKLAEWRVRNPIGGTWTYRYSNFDLHPKAKQAVFGYATTFLMTARDMARLGLLWLNDGRWGERQVAPAEWVREATRVSDMVVGQEPEATWRYGLGFWCNDRGILWPALPRESFAAVGAGKQFIWVDRAHDLVVVQSPGTFSGSFSPADGAEAAERVLGALA